MAVELELTEEEARLIWCQGVNAQKGFRQAAKNNNKAGLAYYGGWALQLLDRIGHAAPPGLRPDGSESDKP